MLGNVRNSASALRIFRGIRTNAILREIKPTATNTTSACPSAKHNTLDTNSHRPTEWEKKILVWTKKFPNRESIPEKISLDAMQAAMSRGRIRIANYMIALALMGCLYVVIKGKLQVAEATKGAQTEYDEVRRQITAEYRAMKAEEAKK